MTSLNKRPNFVNSILQALLVFSIVGFVLGTTGIFISSNACGVYAYGAVAIYCLLNIVGIILIQRWHKVGVCFCMLACLVECVSLYIWGYPLSTSRFTYLLYIIPISVFIFMVTLLLVLKAKSSGKRIWNEMKGGMDVKHSRHIYQLTSFLLLGVILSMCFYKPSAPVVADPTSEHDDAEIEVAQRIINYALLDSVNVTLNEIVSIESMIDSISLDSQLVYRRRIFALKHVLLSGLMTDKHNTPNLKNIYIIHMGEFSIEQQKVLDWYLALSPSEQEVWLDCPSVDNLSDFEKEVKQRITIISK